jgi:ribosomal protein L32
MWEQLSPTQKFWVVASGVLALCNLALGMLVLLSGAWRGVALIVLGVYFAHRSYNLATRGTEDPEGAYDFNKCSACGKFTRGATVCRHCGHDLTHSVSDTPPTKVHEKLPTTSDAPATEAHGDPRW